MQGKNGILKLHKMQDIQKKLFKYRENKKFDERKTNIFFLQFYIYKYTKLCKED